MKIKEFLSLPVVEDMRKAPRLKVGDKFLTGTSVIAQLESKEEGHLVTYYEVVEINPKNGNVSYAPRYTRLNA